MSPQPPWRLPELFKLPQLPPWLNGLPGWQQRRRALAVLALGGLVLLLRPYGPVVLLPGWLVGALLFWGVWELLCWAWWPRRWR
jgi:hypothetical protein